MYRKNLAGATALPNDNGLGTPIGNLHYDLWRARFGNTSAANDAFQHAILAADVGEAIYGNGTAGSPATAAGRRVFFFMSDFGFFDLSADGVKLFDAAIDWAAADPPVVEWQARWGPSLNRVAARWAYRAFERHR